MADYTTPAAVMDALAIDATDTSTLQTVCTGITTFINNQCGRDFRPVASSVRYYNPTNYYCVDIHDASAVTAVATDDAADGTYSTVWPTTDWQAQPVDGIGPAGQIGWPFTNIVAVESRFFYYYLTNFRPLVKVTATWGWANIPDDIPIAALMVAEESFKAVREAPFGSANMADFGPITIRGNRRVDQILQPYKTDRSADGKFLVA
jgi:hypothetical protein